MKNKCVINYFIEVSPHLLDTSSQHVTSSTNKLDPAVSECCYGKKGKPMCGKPVAAGKSSFELIDTQKVFQPMDVKPGANFLDLACGTGRYSIETAKNMGRKGKVYAIDLWQEGIEALNQEIETQGITNLETMIADIRIPDP